MFKTSFALFVPAASALTIAQGPTDIASVVAAFAPHCADADLPVGCDMVKCAMHAILAPVDEATRLHVGLGQDIKKKYNHLLDLTSSRTCPTPENN
eukprot:gene749-494_t